MRYLVTGGLGFIGSNLVDMLLKEPDNEVIVIDDLSTGLIQNRNVDSTVIIDSIFNIEKYKEQIGKVDVIFHLAALPRIQPSFKDPVGSVELNTLGTAIIANFAVSCGATLVYAGSSSFYSGAYDNPYTFTKWQGEEVCKMYSMIYGLKARVARFFNVYGPRQSSDGEYSTVVGIFEKQFESNKKLTITGDGEQRRDFVHVLDVCMGLILMSSADKNEESYCVYNLGTGKNYSINELAMLFAESEDSIEYIPARPGEARETLADIEDTKRNTGYNPTNSLEDYVAKFKKVSSMFTRDMLNDFSVWGYNP
jgi:UDP-glucose 4-epimerase